MPRRTRDTPIATPTGIAVTHAAMNAVNTRNIDQPKCSASGASVNWPVADSYSRCATTSGVGRNSGGTQRKWLASHHSTSNAMIVTVLIIVVGPSPGVVNREVLTIAGRRDVTAFVMGGAGAASEAVGGVMRRRHPPQRAVRDAG